MTGGWIGAGAGTAIAVTTFWPGVVGEIARVVAPIGGYIAAWGSTLSWSRMRANKKKGDAS